MMDQQQARGATLYNDGARAFRAIAAECGDYSERLLVDSAATAQQLAAAKSMPEWFQVMIAFSQRSYEDHMQQMTRIAGMVADAAGDQTRAVQALMAPDVR